MHWIALIAAGLALVLARLMRAPDKSRLMSGALWFGAAFIVTTFTVRVVSEDHNVTRPTQYDQFVTYALEQVASEPDAPFVVFLGASFSRNAIDDEALTQQLRAVGYPHRVINLSLEGASLQERDAHLWQFMRLTGRAPDVVFLEVAEEYDVDPTYVFRVAKFSDRAIEQFDPDAVYWSMKGLSQGNCEGMAACVKAWGLLKVHALMNFTNLGLLATGEAEPEILPDPAFDPQDVPRPQFTLEEQEIATALAEPLDVQPGYGPAWARLFRMDQRNRLERAGVDRVAYYYPPVLSRADREYVARLCAGELADFACIAPSDRAMLGNLSGELWFDEKHLLSDGAEIYTTWLAGQMEMWGALQ